MEVKVNYLEQNVIIQVTSYKKEAEEIGKKTTVITLTKEHLKEAENSTSKQVLKTNEKEDSMNELLTVVVKLEADNEKANILN